VGRQGFTNGAYEFFQTLGLAVDFISPESRWQLTPVSFSEFLKKTPQQARRELAENFSQVFELIQPVLDRTSVTVENPQRTYINNHGLEHGLKVSQETEKLLQMARGFREDIDDKTIVCASIAAMVHDIGCIFSGKEGHASYSFAMLPLLFTDINPEDQIYWDSLSEAVLLHEINKIADDHNYEELSPTTQALLLADKVDIGVHRVNPVIENYGETVLDTDGHTAVNFFVDNYGFCLGSDRTLYFYFDFSLSANDFLETYCPHFVKYNNDGPRKKRSKKMKTVFKEDRISYLDSYQEILLNIYHKRILVAAKAGFALFPSQAVESINFCLIDDLDTDKGFSQAVVIEVNRDSILQAGNLEKSQLADFWRQNSQRVDLSCASPEIKNSMSSLV